MAKVIERQSGRFRDWLPPDEFARLMNKSRGSAVRILRNAGLRCRHVGRTPVFKLADFEFYMEHGVAPPAPKPLQPLPRRTTQPAPGERT